MQVICAPLGWLMRAAYSLTGNYGLAVILFTLMTKVILLPVSLWVHANGIRMVRLEPAVNRLKTRYFGDPDRVADEQALLYKKEHYSPFAAVIPVVLQVVLLIGLVQIISHPDVWLPMADPHTRFLGFDLSATPAAAGGIHLLLPVLAGLAALALSLSQNRLNPLQRSQKAAGQFLSGAVSVGISLVLGFTVPAGVGFYWIWSNLFTTGRSWRPPGGSWPPIRTPGRRPRAAGRRSAGKRKTTGAFSPWATSTWSFIQKAAASINIMKESSPGSWRTAG